MSAPIRGCSPPSGPSTALSFTELKERQLVFLLARQLADAQFVRGDRAASERLWQEVAALEIDPERIIALLYTAPDLDDSEAMEQIDREHRAKASRSRGWFGGLAVAELKARSGGGWHRTSPRARLPVRLAGR